jgi:hypothetical protein
VRLEFSTPAHHQSSHFKHTPTKKKERKTHCNPASMSGHKNPSKDEIIAMLAAQTHQQTFVDLVTVRHPHSTFEPTKFYVSFFSHCFVLLMRKTQTKE